MKEDGARLSLSIKKGNFHITDNLTGKVIINSDGNFTAFTLDKDIVITHIQNLQEALFSYVESPLYFPTKKIPVLSNDTTVVIRENKHFNWTISHNGKSASLADNTYTYVRGFDKNAVLSAINKVYAALLTAGVSLNPKRDIVRRIADVGVLVWVYNGHSIVAYENNIDGIIMKDCLIDGVFYPIAVVSSSREEDVVRLFDNNMQEIITYPLDASVLEYFTPDEDMFNELYKDDGGADAC